VRLMMIRCKSCNWRLRPGRVESGRVHRIE
jgi:hypothetical protein